MTEPNKNETCVITVDYQNVIVFPGNPSWDVYEGLLRISTKEQKVATFAPGTWLAALTADPKVVQAQLAEGKPS